MDLERYKQLFVEEARQYLVELDDLLAQGQDLPQDRQRWRETHTRVHSIKGMAVALELDDMSRLSRAMEKWCYELKEGMRQITPDAVDVLREGASLLSRMLHEGEGRVSPETAAQYTSLCHRLELDPSAGNRISP